MDSPAIPMPYRHQAVLSRFVAACQADERVVAAILCGSYARGAADACSDLDLGVITTDAAHEDFVAGRAAFVRQIGELALLEDFDLPNIVFVIFSDGVECELALGRESRLDDMHSGPYRVLLDKKGILAGVAFPRHEPAPDEQIETLRRLVCWFWHDLSHFMTAMARGQLWWAYGQIDVLRRYCVNLARLQQNFSARAEDYDKVEHALTAEQLSPLQATCCQLEQDAMLRAALAIVRFYQELAPPLAQAHAIPYSADLERVMVARLEQLL